MTDEIAGVENARLENDGQEFGRLQFDSRENDRQRHSTNAMENHL